MKIGTLTPLLLLLAALVLPVHAQENDQSAEGYTGLQTLVATEAAYYSVKGVYGTLDDLASAKMIDPAMLTTGVSYHLKVSDDGQAYWARTRQGERSWETNQIGTILEVRIYRPLGQADIGRYFSEKQDQDNQIDTVTNYCISVVANGVIAWSAQNQGRYPSNIDSVVAAGLLEPGFYPNPVTASAADQRNARCVPLGEWSPGNFSFVPCIDPNNGQCGGCYIVGYSVNPQGGKDVNDDCVADGVVEVLVLGGDYVNVDDLRTAFSPPGGFRQ